MAVSLLKTKDSEVVLHAPLGGMNVVSAFGKQPNVPIDQASSWYARTSPRLINFRGYDQRFERARGGSRSGISRYIAQRAPGSIMGLNTIVGTGYTDPGGGVQSSQSGRVVTLVAVANGNIRIASAGGDTWITPTNGTAAMNSTGLVYSAPNAGKLFFVDGTNYKYYQPSDNTVYDWVATDGVLPGSGAGENARLIWTWHGRTGLSGFIGDPQNWYLSEVGNPFGWNFSPNPQTPAQAFAGNNADFGRIGDVVTCPIPFNDDILIFGCDHSIWAMQGDPMDGGRLVRISEAIGMAWGAPWCSDPFGNVYFWSNRNGIYRMNPTESRPQPVRISQQIDPLLATVNTGGNTITMAWNDRWQGFHVFVTITDTPYRAVHLFYEARTNAWMTDVFTNRMHNPLCCHTFDGNTEDDRVVLIGSWDGYVRFMNPAAEDDDGTPIESEVWIGPLLTQNHDAIMATEMQATLGETGGAVRYDIHVGKTAEAALASESVVNGVWGSGRNHTKPIRREGYAIYLKLSSTVPWAMESVLMRIRGLGPILQKGA